MIYDVMNYDHSLFWRTRRAISAGGFLTTIYSITDVAAASAYLGGGVNKAGVLIGGTAKDNVPCKDILCMIIPEIDFCRSPNWNPSCLPIPSFQ